MRLLAKLYNRLWWALRRHYLRRARRARFAALRRTERLLRAYDEPDSIERRRAGHQDWQRWR